MNDANSPSQRHSCPCVWSERTMTQQRQQATCKRKATVAYSNVLFSSTNRPKCKDLHFFHDDIKPRKAANSLLNQRPEDMYSLFKKRKKKLIENSYQTFVKSYYMCMNIDCFIIIRICSSKINILNEQTDTWGFLSLRFTVNQHKIKGC